MKQLNINKIKEIYIDYPLYKRHMYDIIDAVQREYNKLSYPEKILWDCITIYNDEFILPMRIYGKAMDMNEYHIFCKELVLNLKEQNFI